MMIVLNHRRVVKAEYFGYCQSSRRGRELWRRLGKLDDQSGTGAHWAFCATRSVRRQVRASVNHQLAIDTAYQSRPGESECVLVVFIEADRAGPNFSGNRLIILQQHNNTTILPRTVLCQGNARCHVYRRRRYGLLLHAQLADDTRFYTLDHQLLSPGISESAQVELSYTIASTTGDVLPPRFGKRSNFRAFVHGADQVDPQLVVEHGLPYHASAWVVTVVPEVDHLSCVRLRDGGDLLTDTSAEDQRLDMRQSLPLPCGTPTFGSMYMVYFLTNRRADIPVFRAGGGKCWSIHQVPTGSNLDLAEVKELTRMTGFKLKLCLARKLVHSSTFRELEPTGDRHVLFKRQGIGVDNRWFIMHEPDLLASVSQVLRVVIAVTSNIGI
ncbi:hypothetical protein EDD15DRAFT_2192751 [Pisolithus albus]|nr:hypothetical protein EDD15DRAFT_2192751 [Pisolithus albus]